MINLRRTSGELVARDVDVAPPGALRAAVVDAFPGARVAVAGPQSVFFAVGGRLLKAPFVRYGSNDFWVDRDGAETVATMAPRGPTTAELLLAARPLGADFAEIPPSVWADPHPAMRVERVPSILEDLGEVSDYAQVPPSTWGRGDPAVASTAEAPVGDDYVPLKPTPGWS